MNRSKGQDGWTPSLRDVLRAVEIELAAIGRLSIDVQEAVGCGAPDMMDQAKRSEKLQGLDQITQHLHEISSFLAAVGSALPLHWRCNAHQASQGISVSQLAERLSCANLDHCSGLLVNPGVLELF